MEGLEKGRIKQEFTVEQLLRVYDFIMLDDLEFYEENILGLSEEQQRNFLKMNPDFMSDYPVKCDRIDLLKDEMFRSVLKQIKKQYEEEK